MKPKRILNRLSEEQALQNLEQAARALVREFRYWPYRTKIDRLRIPLIQLKLARKNK